MDKRIGCTVLGSVPQCAFQFYHSGSGGQRRKGQRIRFTPLGSVPQRALQFNCSASKTTLTHFAPSETNQQTQYSRLQNRLPLHTYLQFFCSLSRKRAWISLAKIISIASRSWRSGPTELAHSLLLH